MTPPASATIDPEAVRAIVAEVLRRLHVAGFQPAEANGGHPQASRAGSDSDGPAARPAVASGPPATAGIAVPGRVISLALLEKLPAGTSHVMVDATAVITPSAREHARDNGIAIERAPAARSGPAAVTGPFLVAHAECGSDAASRAAALARAVPGAAQLPATGLADVVATLAMHASRDAARGALLTGKPALAAVLANRSASVRAVTGRDPATLAAAAAECNANLLIVDPSSFPAAALLRLAAGLATKPAGETPADLAARPAGCGCKGH